MTIKEALRIADSFRIYRTEFSIPKGLTLQNLVLGIQEAEADP